jgi:hypothetical protein
MRSRVRSLTIGLFIRDFAIDPTEDLIAYLEDDSKYVTFTPLGVIANLPRLAL